MVFLQMKSAHFFMNLKTLDYRLNIRSFYFDLLLSFNYPFNHFSSRCTNIAQTFPQDEVVYLLLEIQSKLVN